MNLLGFSSGATTDGADPSIKATVFDYTNSNPLAVVSVDASGNPVAGGSAVSIADGADVAEGSTTDAAVLDANGTVNAHARGMVKVLADMWDSINHRLHVAIDSSVALALTTGSAIIGRVGIDQTTPGTTNNVAIISGQNGVAGGTGVDGATVQRVSLATNVALPAGSNVIGHVIADTGSTTAVTQATGTNLHTVVDSGTITTVSAVTAITNALPAGTAVIGNVKHAGYQNACWAQHHIPAANTVATCTQASAGGSLKNVCLGFTVTLASSATTAPAAIQLTASLIDGGTGTTTYLWRSVISLPAVAGAITSISRNLPDGFEGTAATAMCLELSAAGGSNTIESVSMYGTTRL